jgi:hypothetical protein
LAVLALSGLLAGSLTGLVGSAAVTGPAAATGGSPGSAPLPLQEFVSDHLFGRTWNVYDQTAGAAGPTLFGRPSSLVTPGDGFTRIFARSATGDLVEYVNNDLGGKLWNVYDLTATAKNGVKVASAPFAIDNGMMHVYVEGANGDLMEFVNDGSANQPWSTYDITVAGRGGWIAAAPTAIYNGLVHVYVKGANNDLTEYVNDSAGGHLWNAYDLTVFGRGGWIAAAPTAIYNGLVHVYVQGANNDLTEYVNDGAGGHLWNAYDLTVFGRGGWIAAAPTAIYNGLVHVYVQGANNDLTEYVNDSAGGRLWNAYDLSRYAGGGGAVLGSPAIAVAGAIHVLMRSGAGHLIDYVNDGAFGHLWNGYDISGSSSGPALGDDASAVVEQGVVHVYGGGPPPGATAAQIVRLAESQDQYNGKISDNPSGSDCNPYTFIFGRGSTSGCAPGNAAEAWCSDFAQWVWTSAGVNTTGITGWSFTFVRWGQSHTGALKAGATNNPQPGDAVVWGDMGSSYGQHVGIVVGVSQGLIDVVSGNSGDGVVNESGYFDPSTSTIYGYSIVGYISPTGWSAYNPAVVAQDALGPAQEAQLIATQDGGR